MPPEIEAFDHIHVYVADRAAAEQWYRQVLGFARTPELAVWASGGDFRDPDGNPYEITTYEHASARELMPFARA